MGFSGSLLLKGLAGVAALGAVGGGGGVYVMKVLKSKEEEKKAREEVNDKLETLGLGDECRLGEDEDPYTISKKCGLDEGKLKAIKFSNKGEGELKVVGQVPAGLKLKVERKDKEGDISFSFTGLTTGSDIKIFGDKGKGKIFIKNEEQKFKEKEGKLEKDSSGVDATLKTKLEEFNKQLETVKAPLECRFDEAEKEDSFECPITEAEFKGLKFSGLGEGDLTVKGQVPENLKLKVEKDAQNSMSLSFTGLSENLTIYGSDTTKGKIIVKNSSEGIKKFKVEAGKLTKGTPDETLKRFNGQLGTIKAPIECRFDEAETDTSVECNITEAEFKNLEFSNKGDGALTVKTWPTAGGVKLKAEKDSASQSEMSISFTGVTSDIKVFGEKTKRKIIIKGDGENNKKFKVIDNKLTKDSKGVDTKLKTELEKFNKELETVKAPQECRFDEAEGETTVECDVTSDELKKMVFSKDQEELTLGEEDFSGMKLEVQFKGEEVDSEDSKILTFKDYKETVKLKKDQKDIVSFIKGTNPEFVINDEDNNPPFLAKKWKPDDFGELLKLTCNNSAGDSKQECTFSGESNEINLGKGTGDEFEKLTSESIKGKNFDLYENVEDYNQGFKFVFNGEKISGNGASGLSLEPNTNYEFKWKLQSDTRIGYLVKKS